MEQVLKTSFKSKKKRITKAIISAVATELVGPESVDILFYLRGKENVSEFIIAEALNLEIHAVRNILYRLFENNLVKFLRKKDKIKGWYVCYWTFREEDIPHIIEKIRKNRINKFRERLEQEMENQFYMCGNACARMNFEKAMEFEFKCPECSEIMNQQDNSRTIAFLRSKIEELENV